MPVSTFVKKTRAVDAVDSGQQARKMDGDLAARTVVPTLRSEKSKCKEAIIENFHCGDFMYGTSAGRDVNYLKKLEDYHKSNVVDSPDGESNKWARIGNRNTRSMIINSYSDPVRTALSDEFERLKRNSKGKRGRFTKSCLGKAISLAEIGRPARYGFDFNGYKEIASKHKNLKIKSKHADEWLWWKRGSKSGLEMVAQQSPDSRRRVHFILDGMNIPGVIHKNENLFGSTITASELRYIYRHWDRLQGRVIFYSDGRVVDAPWEGSESSRLWKAYR